MPPKNALVASKKLNKIISVVENNLFNLEVMWFRTVYEGAEIPNTALHSHSFYELHLCLSSANYFEVNGSEIYLQKGEFLLLPPKTKHIVQSYEKGYSELVSAFSFNESCAIKDFFENSGKPFFKNSATDFMTISINSMLSHLTEDKYGCNEFVLKLANCFFIDLFAKTAAKIENHPARFAKDNDDRIEIAKKYIEDNIDKKIMSADIANQVNVSTRHLNRLIKNSENVSVSELIRRTRIKQAKKLLMTTQKSLSEISFETGFGSPFYFCKTFKDVEGVTPGAYRRDINK